MNHIIDHIRSHWLLVVFGTILYIISVFILFWNEARAVNNSLSLDEVLNNVISIRSDDTSYNQHKLEGKLVHITGALTVEEPLTEPDYNIQVLAVKLKRRVQMYQWIEEEVEHKYGESIDTVQTEDRNYYYTQDWRDNLIDSSHFYIRSGHENPKKFPIESRIQIADHVNIGHFELGNDVKQKINNFVHLTSDSRPDDPTIKLHSGLYYHCNDVWNKETGDLRIHFSFAGLEGSMYTIVGEVRNGKVLPYDTSLNIRILLVFEGEHSLGDTFKAAHSSYKTTTIIFRIIGWILLFFGVTCTSKLLSLLFSECRILWTIAPDQRYPTAGNIILSFSITLIITSLAWIVQRPWLGGSMIVAAISPFILFARGIAQYHRLPYE